MKLLAAFLAIILSAAAAQADNLADLAGWPTNGKPVGSEWNTGTGFTTGWHCDQVDAAAG